MLVENYKHNKVVTVARHTFHSDLQLPWVTPKPQTESIVKTLSHKGNTLVLALK